MNHSIKLITTASDLQHPGLLKLIESLDKWGWNYSVISKEYEAYGSKMVNAYKYAKACSETHLFIVDAYDVVVLSTMQEALDKMPKGKILFNAEKSCWPYGEWAERYPICDSEWRYLNGGVCFVEVAEFVKMFEKNPILPTDNDQVNLAELYLSGKYDFTLDTKCDVFQSYAHVADNDFEMVKGRLFNLKNNTKPVFVHGNGRTDMSLIYELV